MVHVRLTEPFDSWCRVWPPTSSGGATRGAKDLLAHDCIRIRSRTTGALYVWELERGKKTWRVPVRGPVITSDDHLMIAMAEAGSASHTCRSPRFRHAWKRGRLRLVLEPFAPRVPGLFLYFPSRTQVSPAFALSWIPSGRSD